MGTLLVGLALLTQGANAATLEVCQSGPPCYASIQNAVYSSNNGDTVLIRAGNYYEQVDIDVGIEVIGDGENVVTLTGNTGAAVLDIDTEQPVSISGLTLVGQNRRCIHIGGGDLTLESMTCQAGRADGNGGGLLATSTTIQADSVTFTGNVAGLDGGAMHVSGDSELILDNSLIALSQGARGGGLYLGTDSTLVANNTVFLENQASNPLVGDGNGLFFGGALYADSTTIELTNCDLDANSSSDDGGGIFAIDTEVTLTGGTYNLNSAGRNGGVVAIDGGALTATALQMTNNDAPDEGGAIRIGGLADIDLVEVDFIDNTASIGGAIDANWANTFLVAGGLHSGNSASTAGSIQTFDDGVERDFSIDGVVFENNETTGLQGIGGAVAHNGFQIGTGVELRITDCIFTGNQTVDEGGAVASYNTAALKVEDSTFINNDGSYGGAISIKTTESAKLTRNYFCNNAASQAGGAVLMDGGGDTRTWTNNIFSGNYAHNDGGAVWTGSTPMKLQNNTFAGNEAGISGGSVYMTASSLEWTNNLTMATVSGDGLTLTNGTVNTFNNNAWWMNNAIDTNIEAGARSNDLVLGGNGPPVMAYTGNCESDDFTIVYEGELFDAGDPAISDPDGGPSDIGALGGPSADSDAWQDQDGDGVAAMWDCDEEDPAAGAIRPWYPDNDNDGFGDDDASPVMGCEPPDDGSWSNEYGDCQDGNPDAYPGADEYCNQFDTDCDGEGFDPESLDAETWYADSDGDGWGDDATGFEGCDPGKGFTTQPGDCDDSRADVHPETDETWYDGIDQDCDGWSDFDQDLDGYDSAQHIDRGDDCDDSDAFSYPGAIDGFEDDIDQDCNGTAATSWMNGGGGCACDASTGSGAGWFVVLLTGLLARRRR